MDKNDAEIEQVFDRMHRQSRPGPGIRVLMMNIMNISHERFPVDRPVDEVKMAFPVYRDSQKKNDEPYRVVRPCYQRSEPG